MDLFLDREVRVTGSTLFASEQINPKFFRIHRRTHDGIGLAMGWLDKGTNHFAGTEYDMDFT